jgi:acetyl-CoA synthetase
MNGMTQELSPTDPSRQDALWAEFVVHARANPDLAFQDHLVKFHQIFARRRPEDGPPPVWQPGEEQWRNSHLGRLLQEKGFKKYSEFHGWTAENRAEFWQNVLTDLNILFCRKPDTPADFSGGPAATRWLPGAEFNCVDSCFTAASDRPAIFGGTEWSVSPRIVTYGELERLVNRVANGLRERGYGPGSRIALYMPMTVECVAAYLAVIRAGAAVVSIADSFSAEELARRLEIASADGIITTDGYLRGGKLLRLYVKVKAAAAPPAVVVARAPDERPELRAGDCLWDDLLSDNEEFQSHCGQPYHVINILFSSGTTGTPKAIPWHHLTPVKCAMDGRYHQDIHAGDVVAWPTNIGWMMGPWLIFASLMNDAAMALYEGAPHGGGFVCFVRDAGVSILGVVPSLVRAWRAAGLLVRPDWPGVRLFSSTGEPSNVEDYLWLMSRTGYRAPVIEYLGGTEIGGGHITGTVLQPASPATFTTPALGLDFVILDEHGRPVDVGDAGELFLIPPSIGLSRELLNQKHDPIYYEGCPRGPNGEVLRRHGDEMARLPGGFYRAHGRADDTMNLGGIKISSVELEQVLAGHSAVGECAAVAVRPPGNEGADRLVVFVVLEEEVEPARLKKELGLLLANRLNPLFRIFDLVVTLSLPRTASNKVMRRALRAAYHRRHDEAPIKDVDSG